MMRDERDGEAGWNHTGARLGKALYVSVKYLDFIL